MKSRMILTAATLGTLVSASAFADDTSLSATAPAPKMRAQAQIELLPIGTGEGKIGDTSMSTDTAMAYGVSAMFDYAITPYLSIGVAPRLVLNVISDKPDDGDKADKELDLRARLVGHFPVATGLEAYAALTPGYSFVLSSTDGVNSAKGFALGGALGVTYDVSPSMFLGAEVGYQRAFTSTDVMLGALPISADLNLSYMHVGLGAGTRF